MSDFFTRLADCGIDTKAALERFMNNETMYLKFFRMFFTQNTFAALKEQIGEGDYEEAYRSAHALKGVTGNLELTPLYQAVIILEQSLKTKQTDHLETEFAAVESAYDQLEALYQTL